MGIAREAELLTAAGFLCSAADNLRAVGLQMLADEIDAFIASIDLEILLGPLSDLNPSGD
jgi:hypothetical protein